MIGALYITARLVVHHQVQALLEVLVAYLEQLRGECDPAL